MVDACDPDDSKKFVMEKRMSSKEIRLVRKMLIVGNLMPGFKGKITPEFKRDIEKILKIKEEENKQLNG